LLPIPGRNGGDLEHESADGGFVGPVPLQQIKGLGLGGRADAKLGRPDIDGIREARRVRVGDGAENLDGNAVGARAGQQNIQDFVEHRICIARENARPTLAFGMPFHPDADKRIGEIALRMNKERGLDDLHTGDESFHWIWPTIEPLDRKVFQF
jgi:hypothetical protein